MDVSQFKNPYLIGMLMALMIGPVFFMLLKTSILKGVRAALVFDFGVIFGDITFILIAYFGSKPLLEKIQDDPRLILAGGVILIIYGLITFFDPKNKKELTEGDVKISKTKNHLKLFINGYLLNFINVGVLAGWLGIMIIVAPSLKMNADSVFWFFTKVLIGYLVTDIIKILLAKQLKKKMTPLVVYRMKKAMGVFLIAFGAIMAIKSFVPKDKVQQMINKVNSSEAKSLNSQDKLGN